MKKKRKTSSGGKEVFLSRINKPEFPPCCPNGRIPFTHYAQTGDLWDAPKVDRKGKPLTENERYRLHERKFFHSLNIHDDEKIAKMLNIAPDTLTNLLIRVNMKSHKESINRVRGWGNNE